MRANNAYLTWTAAISLMVATVACIPHAKAIPLDQNSSAPKVSASGGSSSDSGQASSTNGQPASDDAAADNSASGDDTTTTVSAGADPSFIIGPANGAVGGTGSGGRDVIGFGNTPRHGVSAPNGSGLDGQSLSGGGAPNTDTGPGYLIVGRLIPLDPSTGGGTPTGNTSDTSNGGTNGRSGAGDSQSGGSSSAGGTVSGGGEGAGGGSGGAGDSGAGSSASGGGNPSDPSQPIKTEPDTTVPSAPPIKTEPDTTVAGYASSQTSSVSSASTNLLYSGATLAEMNQVPTTVDYITVAGSGSSTVSGDIHNQDTVNGGTGQNVLNLAGNVNGSGGYTGNVEFSGTFSPGNSPAHVIGDTMIFDGTLVIELGGTDRNAPNYDSIDLTGEATLGGTLDVRLIAWPHDGSVFAPEVGDVFDILRASLFEGQFANILFPELDGAHFEWQMLLIDGMWDFRLTVVSDAQNVVFSVRPDISASAAPEPATLAAFGLGLALVVLVRRRRAA
jgi:hypothetical protein